MYSYVLRIMGCARTNTRLKLKYLQPDLFSFSDLFSSCCSVLCCMCCCCCGVVCLVLRAACTYILRIFPSKGSLFFRKISSLNSTGRRTAHSPPRIYVLSMLLFGRACDLVLRIYICKRSFPLLGLFKTNNV